MEKEKFMSYAEYYESMINTYTQQRNEAREILENLYFEVEKLFNEVKNSITILRDKYNFDAYKYSELFKNEYNDGTFLRVAQKLYYSQKNGINPVIFNLYDLAIKQEQISTLEKDIRFYNKILNLSFKDFRKILKTFYNEVHKHLILNGEGYPFEDKLGWICINRCIGRESNKKALDFKKTRENKNRLIAEGKRIWNAKEANWCKERGIPYEVEDYRVWQESEIFYEVPLLNCRLTNGSYFKLALSNTVPLEDKKLSFDDILVKYPTVNDILNSDLCLKHKINFCIKLDNTLYLNYIRNENQQSVKFEAYYSKDRQ